MSITFLFQEASGSFSTVSGRVLTVTNLGDTPSVLNTFLYSSLSFFPSGAYSIATGSISGATTSGYYAYQWGNAGGWSLESPWIKGSGPSSGTCLVYGTSYNLDGTPASGSLVTATYHPVKGLFAPATIIGTKSKSAVVAYDGSWSMELLVGAKVIFNQSINSKLITFIGVIPNLSSALVDSFVENS